MIWKNCTYVGTQQLYVTQIVRFRIFIVNQRGYNPRINFHTHLFLSSHNKINQRVYNHHINLTPTSFLLFQLAPYTWPVSLPAHRSRTLARPRLALLQMTSIATNTGSATTGRRSSTTVLMGWCSRGSTGE